MAMKLRAHSSPDGQRSLFGEILDWMLAPLLFVWPVSIAVTHFFANSVASYPYDQSLREQVSAIARQVRFVGQKPEIQLSGPSRALLRSDEIDSVYYHVVTRDGQILSGDRELPLPEKLVPRLGSAQTFLVEDEEDDEDITPGEVYFRDTQANGQGLRIAYMYLDGPSLPKSRWLLVEVGETLEKRSQLANKIIASVILPQFVLIPLTVILVWFGLSQGLKPLNRLRAKIESRPRADLSPIRSRHVPEELQPLFSAFNAMLERMRANVEAQQRFIADAAHQLRTPLTGLKTQAQLAMRENDPVELRHALTQIAAGVDRAAHMVSQLLLLARTETGDEVQHRMEPLDLNALLREIVEDWVMRSLTLGIDLGYEPAQTPQTVLGNAFLLREMTNNLIDNALSYTPRGGSVTCRVVPGRGKDETGMTEEEEALAVLEIEDSGISINPAHAQLVFERFYRGDDTGVEGSGLGLSIVREIAAMHDGHATLHPNPTGKGTVAHVAFPLLPFPPEKMRTEPKKDDESAHPPIPPQTGFV